MNCHISVGDNVLDLDGNQQEFDLTPSQCAALKPKDHIGQGSYASAYTVEGDPTRVVKFTVDPADAKSSTALMHRQAKSAARIDKVVKLLGKKTYGPVPVAFYDADADDFVDAVGPQPVYAIVAEKLKPLTSTWQKGALNYFNDRGVRGFRQELARMDPKTFKFPKAYRDRAIQHCTGAWLSQATCTEHIDNAIESLEDIAHTTGVIPLDVHSENWGLRDDGKAALLDLGVSAGAEGEATDALAGMGETALNVTVIVGIGIALWLAARR